MRGHESLLLFTMLLTAALSIGSAQADVVPIFKTIPSELYIEGTENFPGMTFVLFPHYLKEVPAVEVKSGQCFKLDRNQAPILFAVKTGTNINDNSVFRGQPRSKPFQHKGGAGIRSPSKLVRITYRITGIEDNKIVLERLRDQHFDGAGKPLGPPPTTSPNDKDQAADNDKGKAGRADTPETPPVDKAADNQEDTPGIWLMAGVVGLPVLLAFVVIGSGRGRRAAPSAEPENSTSEPRR